MRITNRCFAVLFVLSALVQVNDPDPVPWMLVYGAAAVACVLWELGRLPGSAAAALAAGAGSWGLWVALRTELNVPLGSALLDWDMRAAGSKELREGLGLVLVAAWAAVLALRPGASPPR